MNSITMQKQPYSSAPLPGSPKHTEAWALTESARRMSVAMKQVESANDLEKPAAKRDLRHTIRLNWRLWTIFQAELTVETSPVPVEIRQNMLTLCQFVDKQSVTCLATVESKDVDALININRNIASGLLESGQADPQQNDLSSMPSSLDTET